MTAIPRSLPHLPDGRPPALPRCERLAVRLRLHDSIRLPFHHGGVLHGVLCSLLGHDLPHEIVPFAAESGRVAFGPGDAYGFGVHAFAGACSSLDAFVDGLRRLGARPPGRGPRPTLAGNFALESAERLGPPSLAALSESVERLVAAESVRVRLVSPLRLKLPDSDRPASGSGYANAESFPAGLFLHRLLQRWTFVSTGRFSRARDLPPSPDASAEASDLVWVDVPVRGARGKPGRPRGMTLGGVVGEVRLSGLSPAWCALLALARSGHLGSSVRYGLGAYVLPDLDDAPPFPPARSLLEAMASPPRLARALSWAVRRGQGPGVDGVMPERLASEDLDALRREILEGSYRPSPLLAFSLPGSPDRLRLLATARDRIAQRAAAEVLVPGLRAWARERSFRHRGSAGGSLAPDRALRGLDALFAGDPIVSVVSRWLSAPMVFQGRTLARDSRLGLPPSLHSVLRWFG